MTKDEPAFPRTYPGGGHNGMTLRDWYKGQVLQGLCANPEVMTAEYFGDLAAGIKGGRPFVNAVMYLADAMMEARDDE